MIIRRPGTRRAYAIRPYGLPAECPCASVFNHRTPTEREFDVGQFIYIGMGLPLHDGCKLPCRGSASYLARCLQACLHGVCKPACTRCARKSAFSEAVVGAHDRGVASLTKPALCHSQSQRCVTHKACVVSLTKPALSVSHWGGCLPRGGEGVSPEAGRVSPPMRGECLPRGGEGVSPEAGRVSPPRRGNGFLTSNSRYRDLPERCF